MNFPESNKRSIQKEKDLKNAALGKFIGFVAIALAFNALKSN